MTPFKTTNGVNWYHVEKPDDRPVTPKGNPRNFPPGIYLEDKYVTESE